MTARISRRAALALPALLAAGRAQAAWPDRPIRLVVPFPPGSGTDILARLLAEPFGRALGQSVVLENRPGANGVVGAELVAKAPADGYTLMMMGTSVAAINPHTLRRPPYDPIRDFAPIGTIAETPYVLVVPPAAPGEDFAGWLRGVRGRDLSLGYGNAGGHIMGAMLADMAGLKLTLVPYRGSTEALTDVSTGRLDVTFADFGMGMQQAEAGRVRALAQSLGHPFPLSPNVPPMAGSLPGFDASVWFSMVTQAAVPPAVLAQLEAALGSVLANRDFAAKLTGHGLAPMRMTAAEFGRFLQRQLALWGERVKLARIEAQ
ncbi:tripartite tricarboxylate transporter substrate binding protein [Dankookia rubra]|uniref:Tripartite tricarboxylate transporter substrate binding protein n=1 Tax=Dankookia rubra TaxID=1442381 RepID=A0A4V3AAD4_9PROT|nr:tripartite tricarboxylate transporter substrate binding protein [Dankookia rubra]TDH62695.1 tripartite tricarboxylate transporter substrate binding protein [Dankookia rubra]